MNQKLLRDISLKASEKISSAQPGASFFKEPYKHLVIDNFLEDEQAQTCLANFPDTDDPSWEFANDTIQKEIGIEQGITVHLTNIIKIVNISFKK